MNFFLRFLNSTGVILDSTISFLTFWHFWYKFLIKRFLIKKSVYYKRPVFKIQFCHIGAEEDVQKRPLCNVIFEFISHPVFIIPNLHHLPWRRVAAWDHS